MPPPLHIVIYSPAFYPRLGGLEMVVKLVATELVNLGQKVTIITNTPNPEPDLFNFEVLRQAGWHTTIQKTREADVYMLANISLWGMLPLILIRKSWIAIHQGWYQETGHPITVLNRLKKYLARKATQNISASQAVKACIGNRGVVIHNPYEHTIFRRILGISREKMLVCLARLVSDKGVDLLLDALSILNQRNLSLKLTIIGSGPEESALKEKCRHLDLSDQVSFAGACTGEDLAARLNAHKIMVIPSLWDEPFGVVALEGIACGCFIVGSSGGGLGEAIGPCGITFPNGDVNKLAAALQTAVTFCTSEFANTTLIQQHLDKHCADIIATEYLEVIRQSVYLN